MKTKLRIRERREPNRHRDWCFLYGLGFLLHLVQMITKIPEEYEDIGRQPIWIRAGAISLVNEEFISVLNILVICAYCRPCPLRVGLIRDSWIVLLPLWLPAISSKIISPYLLRDQSIKALTLITSWSIQLPLPLRWDLIYDQFYNSLNRQAKESILFRYWWYTAR